MTRLPMPELKTTVDRMIHAIEGRMTKGLSPASQILAFTDWLIHMAHSPGKISEMAENILRKNSAFLIWSMRAAWDPDLEPFIRPLKDDRRFRDPLWSQFPYNVISQSFLMHEQWWNYATTNIPGVSSHHENMVHFAARQWLDMASPTNFAHTNPVVLDKTLKSGGMNLYQGMQKLLEDIQHTLLEQPQSEADIQVGRDIAVTPGQVIYRNRLIELIQYSPSTETVAAEPILIVPAWIMKYYILDLSPHNSMVKFLVERGHTVYMISWAQPGVDDRDLDMQDYIDLGVMAALDSISQIQPQVGIHAVGYCLGGTLLSICAAAMARDNDSRLQSLTLFTAQTDFTEAGELMLFIDESQLSYMEDIMWDKGYLDTKQMAGAFMLLRSYDLLWSRMVNEYLLGEVAPMNDLMTWNADATRMPYKMHSQYLRQLFLNNDLASGRYLVKDRPISLRDIRVPVFAVATQTDHVAPWRSVYKLNDLFNTEITFVLTSGGHNAGIVSEPGHPRRHYQIGVQRAEDKYIPPSEWIQNHPSHQGSWWEPWREWISRHSSGQVAPPSAGNPESGLAPLTPAPGLYVLEK